MKTMKIWQKLDKHGQNQEFQGIPSKSQPGPIRAGNLTPGGPPSCEQVASKLRATFAKSHFCLAKLTLKLRASCEPVASQLRASCEQLEKLEKSPPCPPSRRLQHHFQDFTKKNTNGQYFSWKLMIFMIFVIFRDFHWFSWFFVIFRKSPET